MKKVHLVSDYRLFAEDTSEGVVYSIHEVMYVNGNPIDFVYLPLSLISTDQEELIAELQLVLEGMQLPALSIKDFPNEY